MGSDVMVTLPDRPAIDRAVLDFGGCTLRDTDDGPMRWFAGDIRPGQVFAWEPDLPHARELLVVTRVGDPPPDTVVRHARGVAVLSGGRGPMVWARPIDGTREYYNDEDRFREAVVPTTMRDQLVRLP